MDMAHIRRYDDISSSALFHSSAKEMIHIHHIEAIGKWRYLSNKEVCRHVQEEYLDVSLCDFSHFMSRSKGI